MGKKKWYILLIVFVAVCSFLFFVPERDGKVNNVEFRGVFVSYLEYMKHFDGKDKDELKQEIDKIIDNAKVNYFNTIILQVCSFSDSIYFSDIYPFTHTITGIQGKKTSFDVLDYFIEKAHARNIEIYAWINPYRISSSTDVSLLSDSSPAIKWIDTNNVKIIDGKGIYYNPASNDVYNLIIDGVSELVSNHKVDGVVFDDYFYPDQTIDLENYKEFENTLSISEFRLSIINKLVSGIYKTIKKIKPNIMFGVSPDGNIDNNYLVHYADVKTWLKNSDYVDFIMPQLYYGFINSAKPFIKTLNEWDDLIVGNIALIPALALYKSGEFDKYAGLGDQEWIENSNIIKKQILVSRNVSHYKGFAIFRYDYFYPLGINIQLESEIANFLGLFTY